MMGTRAASLGLDASGVFSKIQFLKKEGQELSDQTNASVKKAKVVKAMQEETDMKLEQTKMSAKQASQMARQLATMYLGIISGGLEGLGSGAAIQLAMTGIQTYQQYLTIRQFNIQAIAAYGTGQLGIGNMYTALSLGMYGLAVKGLINTQRIEQLQAQIEQQKATTNYVESYS